MVFQDVITRVGVEFSYKTRIDVDEANAALMSGFVLGKIIQRSAGEAPAT